MANPWLALESGADPVERVRAIRRAHEAFLTAGEVAAPVRGVIAESWRRSAGARVGPEAKARIDFDGGDLADYRAAHPLARVMPLVRELLGTIADDGAHLLTVCDERGRLLWVEGPGQLLRRAEHMNFVPGSDWAEPCVGTNAPGTALAVDHAVQIFAAEHYSRPVQPWTCAAAPVHDPRTHRPLGAIDLTGGDHLASPHSLALVRATARAAEAELAESGPADDVCTLTALGRDEALLHPGGPVTAPVRLGPRHSEILVLLTAYPEGLTGERLGLELYGEREVHPVTLRSELSRLRRLLGPLLGSRPYRLRRPVRTDYDAVCAALAGRPDLHSALTAYPGPLLPLSDAPGVVRLRRALEDRLRHHLLSSRDPAALESWVRTPWGEDDLEAWEALLDALPGDAPLRPVLAGRAAELRDAYGLAATGS